MIKAFKSRTHMYCKLTRALLRQLRHNGGRVDGRIQRLRTQQAQALAKLIQMAKAPYADSQTRSKVQALLIGLVGVNDQINAMLSPA